MKLISSNVVGNAIYFQINSAIQMYINGVKLEKELSKLQQEVPVTTTRYRVVENTMTHFSTRFCPTMWGIGQSQNIDEEMTNARGNAIYFQINSAIQMYINGVKLEKRMKQATTGSTGHLQLQDTGWRRAQ